MMGYVHGDARNMPFAEDLFYAITVGTAQLQSQNSKSIDEKISLSIKTKTNDVFDRISFKKTKENGIIIKYLYKIVGNESQLIIKDINNIYQLSEKETIEKYLPYIFSTTLNSDSLEYKDKWAGN